MVDQEYQRRRRRAVRLYNRLGHGSRALAADALDMDRSYVTRVLKGQVKTSPALLRLLEWVEAYVATERGAA